MASFAAWGTEGSNCSRGMSIALQGTPYGTTDMTETTQFIQKAKDLGDYYEPVGYEYVTDPETGEIQRDDYGNKIGDYIKDENGNILYNKISNTYKDGKQTTTIEENVTYQQQPGDIGVLPNSKFVNGHLVMFTEKGGYIHTGGGNETTEEKITDPMYVTSSFVDSNKKDVNGNTYNSPVYAIISTSRYAYQYEYDKNTGRYENVTTVNPETGAVEVFNTKLSWPAIAEAQKRTGN